MKLSSVFLILAITLTACGAPAPTNDAEPIVSAAEFLSGQGGPCVTAADCIPSEKPCGVSVCTAGLCATAAIPTGSPCSTGMGICDATCACILPDLHCKTPGVSWRPCDADSECDDRDDCTADWCSVGWCHHVPVADGTACGGSPGLTCTEGLCCAN